MGELKKDVEGNIAFESKLETPFFWEPVPAKQVIRPDAQHVILVGDRERTNVEMNEWLQQPFILTKKKSWWIYALILSILALGVLLFHFVNNGWRLDALRNQEKLQTPR